ncbi:MAG: nitroreductase [bacterium]
MSLLLKLIKDRRSVREFTDQEISKDLIEEILEVGRWAPSGLNNQPWKFLVVTKKEVLNEISNYTKYQEIIKAAKLLIVVFLDKEASYHYLKDVQAVGACLQNMLLFIHELGLGACWLGEILNQSKDLSKYLGISDHLELMAILAIGYPVIRERISTRKELKDLIIGWK